MKLYVDRITDSPSPERFEPGTDWFSHNPEGISEEAVRLSAGPVFDLAVHFMRRELYLEGSVAFEVNVACSRCLKRYCQPLRETFRLVLEPANGRDMPDPESAESLKHDGLCLGDELEAGCYQGRELALDAYFNEVVAMALPLAPVCRENCVGLCPTCGVNRSDQSCVCNDINPASPFAALAALREPSPNGES